MLTWTEARRQENGGGWEKKRQSGRNPGGKRTEEADVTPIWTEARRRKDENEFRTQTEKKPRKIWQNVPRGMSPRYNDLNAAWNEGTWRQHPDPAETSITNNHASDDDNASTKRRNLLAGV